jgi:hypothetical protein
MELYKEKLCEFLTTSVENFNYSKQIFDLYQNGEMRDFIVMNYLNGFLKNIENSISQSSGGWITNILKRPNEISPNEIYLIIYKNNWKGFSIGWDIYNNEIGICHLDHKIEQKWRTKIINYQKSKKTYSGQENDEWFWWEKFTFDINDFDTLFKMTPINLEINSKEISDRLMSYTIKHEKEVKDILSLKEK